MSAGNRVILDEAELIAFLRSRLDEAEAEYGADDLWRESRTIAAHRAILNEWVNLRDPEHWPEHPAVASARWAAQNIAVVYSDHPDYLEGWKP